MDDLLLRNNLPIMLRMVTDLCDQSINGLNVMVRNPTLKQIASQYKEHNEKSFDIGLNLFTLISNQYRKENFHSDILKEVLDPSGLHDEGDKFLNLFIDYLNKHTNNPGILKSNYKNATVEREAHRIDICIKDIQSKRAIIIESKLNNAPDMYRQIPNYFGKLVDLGYKIDAVIYLVMSGNKTPGILDWTAEERNSILSKTLTICAFNETESDLYNGWLKMCEHHAEKIDTAYLFRQYNRLIYSLGGKNMNKSLMEAFLTNMMQEGNYETANALKNMLNDLLSYRRDKIIDHFRFKALPFEKIGDWHNYAVFNDYHVGESNFSIDVIVTESLYQVQFFDRNYINLTEVNGKENPVNSLLKDIKYFDQFFPVARRMEVQFTFPAQENELYSFLTGFIGVLQQRTIKLYSETSIIQS